MSKKRKIEVFSENEKSENSEEDHLNQETPENHTLPGDDTISSGGISSEVEESITEEERLKKELEETKIVASENWESFLRARADYENFKKRAEQQISAGTITGKRIIIEKLLEVIDNFERALNFDESKVDVKNLLIGVRMIYKQLRGVLEEEGVKEVPTVGNIFDPKFHEALESVISDKYKDEEIIEECVKGYSFKDNILRPAKVKVARIPEKSEE
jgi:molecular chaperone GrpE